MLQKTHTIANPLPALKCFPTAKATMVEALRVRKHFDFAESTVSIEVEEAKCGYRIEAAS